jgi:hypothetical protein
MVLGMLLDKHQETVVDDNLDGQRRQHLSYEYVDHSSSYDCWTQWNIGNLERSIPPLRALASKEFHFLDAIPKEANKLCGQPGKHRANRRPASKQYSDLKTFLCHFLE